MRYERREIASLARDTEIFQGFMQTLQNPDKVLRLECGGDISVYDDIGRDPRIASVLRTRALAVVGKEWEVVPASESRRDKQIAEFVKQAFLGFPFDAARRAILRGGVLKGFAVSEILWQSVGDRITIADMRPRAQRRFRFDPEGGLRLLTREAPIAGENLTALYPRKFQTFCFGDEPETPYGVGLGRELYWPWWFKKNGLKYWLLFCDRFGSPTALGKYPRGSSDAEQEKLLAALEAIQNDAAVTIPEGMSVELLEAAKGGGVDTYEKLCRFLNAEMAVCVLGQSATTEGTPGKLGGDEAQNEVRDDLVKADADALCEALNAQVVRWLVDYNFPGVTAYPKMWIRCEPEEDLKALAERDKIISEMGFAPTLDYITDTYGGQWVEKALPTPAGRPPQAAPAAEFAEGEAFTPEQQALEELADRGTAAAARALRGIEARLVAVVRESKSYEEAMEAVLGLWPEMHLDDLAALLEACLIGAHGAGVRDAGDA